MGDNYGCSMWFPSGDKPENLVDFARIEVAVHNKKPPRLEDDFEIFIINSHYINDYLEYADEHLKDYHYEADKYIIIFQKPDPQYLCDCIQKIFAQCPQTEEVYDAFANFGRSIYEGREWHPAGELSEAEQAPYQPLLCWNFEDSMQSLLTLEQTFFDERIMLTITWPTDTGTDFFEGWWYVTSPSFLRERVKTCDPYYRRHMRIVKQFTKKYLEEELRKRILTELAVLPVEVRKLFLQKNMEYAGQLTFYER